LATFLSEERSMRGAEFHETSAVGTTIFMFQKAALARACHGASGERELRRVFRQEPMIAEALRERTGLDTSKDGDGLKRSGLRDRRRGRGILPQPR
jgi:hypothetical protein